MPKIYNASKDLLPVQHTYVDRRTAFGNRFIIGKHGNRGAVVAKHKQWVNAPEQADFRAKIRRELRGENLVCWCVPKQCHATELMRIARTNEDSKQQ